MIICMSATPKAVGFVSALRKVISLESVQNVAMGFTLDKNVLKYNKDGFSDEKNDHRSQNINWETIGNVS